MESDTTNRPKILFVLTIDTEEEWDWDGGFPVKKHSVQNARQIPKFQTFCRELGVRPTYFIDYAIASDPMAAKYFQEPFEKGECEIGAHLHAWVTPPVEEEIHDENTHAINLPPELVRRKLKNLTQKLRDEFGERATNTFRSGRWGMNETLLQMLIEEGYQIDSSVHPYYADSTFSYYDAPIFPYWPDLENCIKEGTQRTIFEVPVTSGFNLADFAMGHKIHQFLSQKPWSTFHGIGILWHLHLLRKIQLSPELADATNMIALVNACLKRGHRILHMYFHSSSLLPGGTPYVSNKEDEAVFYQHIADVVTYLKAHADVSFCTLTEAKQYYLQENHS